MVRPWRHSSPRWRCATGSRAKIAELLVTWFGVRLSAGTIDRCIREAGLACEPIVEGLLTDLRQSGLINAHETPWPQRGHLRWLWVALSSTTAIYKIASRRAEEIRDLIGEAFLGWLVSDGYVAYRDHPRRQRCLAHLIRKGIGLADGFDYDAARFGAWLVRELRGLIHAVAENAKAGSLTPILARLKRACRLNEDAAAAKARALAREILNDWEAITAFVTNPNLPPTNNDAETALRHAVIARRISFGTRTDEGSRRLPCCLLPCCQPEKGEVNGYDAVTSVTATDNLEPAGKAPKTRRPPTTWVETGQYLTSEQCQNPRLAPRPEADVRSIAGVGRDPVKTRPNDKPFQIFGKLWSFREAADSPIEQRRTGQARVKAKSEF